MARFREVGSVTHQTDDRNGRGGRFNGERRGVIPGSDNHGDLSTHQVGHKCRQAIVLSGYPMVLDRYVAATMNDADQLGRWVGLFLDKHRRLGLTP